MHATLNQLYNYSRKHGVALVQMAHSRHNTCVPVVHCAWFFVGFDPIVSHIRSPLLFKNWVWSASGSKWHLCWPYNHVINVRRNTYCRSHFYRSVINFRGIKCCYYPCYSALLQRNWVNRMITLVDMNWVSKILFVWVIEFVSNVMRTLCPHYNSMSIHPLNTINIYVFIRLFTILNFFHNCALYNVML